MSAHSGPSLSFSKIVATGNDFLFIDARSPLVAPYSSLRRGELARRLCERHSGAGADGLVFIENGSSAGRLKWDFYNSDGSKAEMCGNASRCVGRWADVFLKLAFVELETDSGLVRIESHGSLITSRLEYVALSFQDLGYETSAGNCFATLVNTGVPHAVVEIERIEMANSLLEDIKALRFHSATGPKGANVTFLSLNPSEKGMDRLSTVTYERGVEGFTLSCGTGVLAAAAVVMQRSGQLEAEVQTPGGILRVQYGPGFRGAALTGPADFIFDAILPEEFVR